MKRIAIACGIVFLAGASWRLARACAPDFYRAIFSYTRHPDLPRSAFIDGRLGVLQPTFARSYLIIAYRYLNGIGMNAREREQARAYYDDRGGFWNDAGEDWAVRWHTARARIANPPAPQASLIGGGEMAYDPETHSFVLNCASDAFRVALHTLEDRRRQFGATSPAFRSWLTAQDAVFRNCDQRGAALPEPAPADLPQVLRADREYQTAAARFYAGDYTQALEDFRRIGRNKTSPWSAISRYLVIRTLQRLDADKEIPAEGQAVLADSSLGAIHGMTRVLMDRAGIRQGDPEYFRALASLLSTKGQDDGMREELWTYTQVYDRIIGEGDPNAIDRYPQHAPADPARFRDSDLSDWLFHFQSRDPDVFRHCVDRWRATHSAAWMLAALTHANAAQASSGGLLEAAGKVPESSPAYLTARFHLLRFTLDLGDKASARSGLDAVLTVPSLRTLPSSTNLFRGLRMLASPGLDDFLAFALRRPVLITLQQNLGEEPEFDGEDTRPARSRDLLDGDSTRVLNRQTPFRYLRETALHASLPAETQREALWIAFTRGLMLDEDLTEIAQQMTPDTDPYLKAQSVEEKRFAAALLLLHHPEARPYFATGVTRQSKPGKLDPYRDNWWCPTDIDMDLDSLAQTQWYEPTPNLLQQSAAAVPEFLTGESAAEAKREMERLGQLHAAVDFLGSVVFAYAQSHRDDPRIPEALYWLVRAGEYGCVDGASWKAIRSAFQMLQLRYPNTTWARKTPTWMKNENDIHKDVDRRKGYH